VRLATPEVNGQHGNVDPDGNIVDTLTLRVRAFAGDPELQARLERLSRAICAPTDEEAAAQLDAVGRALRLIPR
jgi:hypothetical protein